MKVACLEEIAYRNQWLSAEGVAAQAERLKKPSTVPTGNVCSVKTEPAHGH